MTTPSSSAPGYADPADLRRRHNFELSTDTAVSSWLAAIEAEAHATACGDPDATDSTAVLDP
jgi:hypothetical protein